MQIEEEVKKAIGLTDKHYINQFPFEACLVMKHHLHKLFTRFKVFVYAILQITEGIFMAPFQVHYLIGFHLNVYYSDRHKGLLTGFSLLTTLKLG